LGTAVYCAVQFGECEHNNLKRIFWMHVGTVGPIKYFIPAKDDMFEV
jgi:hypothetical protein